ncbi:leucyl aminopeptidase [Candidatus Nitrosoglobus terrae]|uniref:Probable cytosol aminopeptidase n=1 Tax=Candidatus Nitrosoglobus terrae TaxID=1630141 RepID=A0A1Q2SMS6_9GAMM|nr:leucyl aminopeptidase [Candidatus Nitrosoglobus terrae]BAW80455.1 leucyl aminopeptidase [Candidatus Nitrosoglobus terrae]
MDYTTTNGTAEKLRTQALIVGIYEDEGLSPSAQRIDKASEGYLSKLISQGDFSGKIERNLLLFALPGIKAERVMLMGCGEKNKFESKKLRHGWSTIIKVLEECGATDVVACLLELKPKHEDISQWARLMTETAEHASYYYDQTKSKKKALKYPLSQINFLLEQRTQQSAVARGIQWGQAIAKGVSLARDLANLPGNICTPTYLADTASKMAKEYKSLTVKILDREDMEKLGMGALLAVARGSQQSPKFICLEYKGTSSKQQPIVLIGKGITFDSGGISIKPAASMDEMKYDMSGGASVLGTIKACAELKLSLNVVALVPCTENLPDGNATKPGDIVTSLSGQTIEILNTDAEGRLILCDALTYSKHYHPKIVIDVATLTGACVIALGAHASGLLSNDQDLANSLLSTGQMSNDPVWQLPLWEDYQQQLKSNFADMANVGGREAGTITAACFLSRFAEDFSWAHLDIAGTAWNSGKDKGATGRPVPLLTQYLIQYAQAGVVPKNK